jgi:hypothetical protein
MEGSNQVGREKSADILERKLEQTSTVPCADIIDENIQPPTPSYCIADAAPDGNLVGYIEGRRLGVAARCHDPSHRAMQRVRGAAVEEHGRTFCGQRSCCLKP